MGRWTTQSSVTGYMPAEVMTGLMPGIPTEIGITTWEALPWRVEMSQEELLAVHIRQLEGRPEDVAQAVR